MSVIYDKKNKLWLNVNEPDSIDPNISLGQKLLHWMCENEFKVAQINDETGTEKTYHELWLDTVRVAQNLQKRGVQSRQVIGFMAGISDHVASTLVASICLACPIAPMHPMLTKDEIVRNLKKSKPVVIFCDTSAYDQLEEALKELKSNVNVFIFGKRIEGLEPAENLLIETGEENNFVPSNVDAYNDIAGIFCSSGTTGPTKSVCLSYAFSAFTILSKYDENTVVLCFDSIYWTAGVKPIIDCIYSGSTHLITTKHFTPEFQLYLIDKYKVNVLYNSPSELVVCLKYDRIHEMNLSYLRLINCYGTKMSNNLIADIKRHFPNASLTSAYGMTEIGLISASDNLLQNQGGEYLANGCMVKIIDEDGNRCGQNVNGEICIQSKYKFLGYLEDPETSAAAVDSEGFFRTGDIGHFDGNGLLFVVDRKKDAIALFYFDSIIFPSEIEKFLITIPDVEAACVVGIPVVLGAYLPAAVIVRKPKSSLSQNDVFNMVAENFPDRYKLRAGVYFVDSIPRTPSGKPLRRVIVESTTEMFKTAMKCDAELRSYIEDIPKELRKLI